MDNIKHSLRFDLRMFVKGMHNLKNTCDYLASLSVAYGIEPWPEDYYAVYVRKDAEHILEVIETTWGTQLP